MLYDAHQRARQSREQYTNKKWWRQIRTDACRRGQRGDEGACLAGGRLFPGATRGGTSRSPPDGKPRRYGEEARAKKATKRNSSAQ